MKIHYDNHTRRAALLVAGLVALSTFAGAQTLGMAADTIKKSVTVFDADADTVLGVVALPTTGYIGDCVINPDQSRGFVSDLHRRVWVIDLTARPPRLATGVNPIAVRGSPGDLSLSEDGRFLLASADGLVAPISVIDVTSRMQVATFSFGGDHGAVEAAADGSILTTSLLQGRLYRARLEADGRVTDTGEMLAIRVPNNVSVAAGATSGVVVERQTRVLRSFVMPGLRFTAGRLLSGDFGIGAVLSPANDRVYARSGRGRSAFVDVFTFDAEQGQLGASPLLTFAVGKASAITGMDQLAIHPDGSRLYVAQTGGIGIHDPDTGRSLGSIPMVKPTGVCFGRGVAMIDVTVDIKPGTATNPLNLSAGGKVPVAILTTDAFDALAVDPATITVAGAPVEAHRNGRLMASAVDVDGDARLDLLVHVLAGRMQLDAQATEATLNGTTFEATPVAGTDAIRIVVSSESRKRARR